MGALETADRIVMCADNARRQAKITVRQLAKTANISEDLLYKWFSGANRPPLYGIAQVLDALGYELVVRRKM